MSPPHCQSVEATQEWGFHVITLYKWQKAWRLQGEMVPAIQKGSEGWELGAKFAMVLENNAVHAR